MRRQKQQKIIQRALLLIFPLLLLILCPAEVFTFPDGAPCLRAVIDSMNPLEAVEHQGGLQLTEPPFLIVLEEPCYRPGQPVALTIRGNASSVLFKGFAMQPLIFSGQRVGTRAGQFVHLDDNGSWQFQCFRQRDSITHSHDEGKERLKIWWRGDDVTETVQFVATVVQSLRKFWVKSVFSTPLPPCSLRPTGFGPWRAPPPTTPEPTGTFKLETFNMFNGGDAQQLAQSLSQALPASRHRAFPQRILQTSVGQQQSGPAVFLQRASSTTTTTPFPITTARTAPSVVFGEVRPPAQQQIQQQQFLQPFRRSGSIIPQLQNAQQTCRDHVSTGQCLQWLPFCSMSGWMQRFCRATCRTC